MTERDALHAAVCAHPDDDTPRLVFADWLQEHDEEERAEFIRVQIELERLPAGKKRTTKEARAKELIAAHGKAWAKPIRKFVASAFDGKFAPIYGPPYEFRRGFVEVIGIEPTAFMEAIDDLFELTPLSGLHFIDASGFNWVAGCERMLRIKDLNLNGCVLSDSGSYAAELLRSKYLANLVRLDASGVDDNGHLDARGLTALAGTRHLTKLEFLDIGDNWMFGDVPAREATACRKLLWRLGAKMPALRALRLAGMGLQCGEISAFAVQPWVAQLRTLDLSGNEIGEYGCRALCESERLAGLEQLDLRDNIGELAPATKLALKARFGKRVLL